MQNNLKSGKQNDFILQALSFHVKEKELEKIKWKLFSHLSNNEIL